MLCMEERMLFLVETIDLTACTIWIILFLIISLKFIIVYSKKSKQNFFLQKKSFLDQFNIVSFYKNLQMLWWALSETLGQ